MSSDAEHLDVAAKYADFIERLMQLTPRPVASTLKEAMLQAFPSLTPGRVNTFAGLITGCITHFRNVSKSVVSGTKIPAGGRRVVNAILASSPGDKGVRRRLRKKSSDEDSVVEVAPARKLTKHNSLVSVGSSAPANPPVPLPAAGSHEGILALYGISTTSVPSMASGSTDPIKKAPLAAGNDVVAIAGDAYEAPPIKGPARCLMQKATPSGIRRYMDSGLIIEGKLTPGDRGFAMATWPPSAGLPLYEETEVPNFCLAGMAADLLMKKPAAADPPVAKRPACGSVVKRPAAAPLAKYSVMYYKKTHVIGIRIATGAKKQVCQGIGRPEMSEAQMRDAAQKVIDQMAAGLSEGRAKAALRAALDVDA